MILRLNASDFIHRHPQIVAVNRNVQAEANILARNICASVKREKELQELNQRRAALTK